MPCEIFENKWRIYHSDCVTTHRSLRYIFSNVTSATLSSDVTEGASVINCSQSVCLMPALGAVYSAVAEGRLKITPQTQLGRAQTY